LKAEKDLITQINNDVDTIIGVGKEAEAAQNGKKGWGDKECKFPFYSI
jgi:hypothetical protein